MKKYWKLPEICSKNLENHKLSKGHMAAPWSRHSTAVLNFFWKVNQYNSRNKVTKFYALNLLLFYEKSCSREVFPHTPQMTLNVKVEVGIFTNKFSTSWNLKSTYGNIEPKCLFLVNLVVSLKMSSWILKMLDNPYSDHRQMGQWRA